MVYQIYYGDKRPGKTVFDIEYFLALDETKKDTEERWYVELHSTPILSESVEFVRNILRPELVDDFIKDCTELEDLRGWIWERHNNRLRTMDAAQKDYAEWGKYIRERIDTFCNKYGLYLNID